MPRVTSKASKRKAQEKAALNEELNEDDGNDNINDTAGEEMGNENLLEMAIPPMPELLMTAANNEERLVISFIEVENFKSYFGRQTIGPFHQNFTAIIGPNGSGKSNVIDSLLFVFGYRASKIRSKKVSVLIHSSAGRENINSCTVSVNFKKIRVRGPDQVETVEGSEFFVSRTGYRDNSSRYTLNGRVTQFKEIAVVLRKCGIDLVHNRFLILQGEVEHISLMKPKAQNENEEGMLEYLEDIIGSSRLKVPINKLVNKLGRLQEQRANQLVRLHHAEKEQQALKGPATTMVLKLRVENAIAFTQTKLHSIKKLSLVTEADASTKIREEQALELEEAQNELTRLTENSRGLKQEHKKLQRDLEKKQETLTALSAELGTKKQAITKMENDKKRLEDQSEKLSDNITKEADKIAELEAVPEKAAEKLRDYETELADAVESIRTNTALIDEKLPLVQEQSAALRDTHQKLEAELGKQMMVEDKCAAKLALAQEALSNLQREESAQRRILGEYRDRLAQMEDEMSTKSRNLETTQASVPTFEHELEELNVEEKRLGNDECRLDEQTRALRVEVEQIRQAAAQFQSTNSLLRAIMEQKKSGKIRGIYGRLGDLGAIDGKYDVAISTTCGALDNIVVDCVETAQLCIKFLQRENLGTASFIALDKQQHYWSRIRKKPNTPENTPRLFDLVRVEDENVLPAFYYALTDTLVAPDIQSATRIGMNSGGQRWRTVTLKGEVVEVSGAMTGGGNTQKRGRIGQEVRVNTTSNTQNETDLRALTEKLNQTDEQLTDVRRKLASVRQKLRERQTDLTRANQLVKNLRADVAMLQKNIDSVSEQISQQEKKLKNAAVNPEVVQEHSDNVDKLKKENDELSKKSDSLRLRSIEVTDRINAVEEEIIGPYQRALREAEERKRVTEKAITKEKNAITSNARNLKNANGRKADFESDLEQVTKNIEKLNQKMEEVTEQLAELEAQLDEHRTAVAEAETAYNDAVERSRELNTDEIAATKRVAELREDLKRVEERIEGFRAKIALIDSKTAKLKLYNLSKLDGLPADVLAHGGDDPLLANSLAITDDNGEAFSQNEVADEEMEVDDEQTENEEDSMEEVGEPDDGEKAQADHKRPLASAAVPMARVPHFTNEQILEFNEADLSQELEDLEDRKAEIQKDNTANLGVLIDYISRAKLHEAELKDFQRISRERDAHREFCERLKKQRLQEFMDGFQLINEHLKEMYQMITLGGDASLDLVDSLDPFSEGVSFGVRPPKKSWKQITNLSGGEKTLASLALVFGLHRFRPTPLYVMDEIDAALDFRNVSIISSYILERTTNAQFIVISLRNNMFERGNRLVGIYKVRDCTYNVVIDPQAAQKSLIKNLKAINYAKKRKNDQNPEDHRRTRKKNNEPIKKEENNFS